MHVSPSSSCPALAARRLVDARQAAMHPWSGLVLSCLRRAAGSRLTCTPAASPNQFPGTFSQWIRPPRNLVHIGVFAGVYLDAPSLACRSCPFSVSCVPAFWQSPVFPFVTSSLRSFLPDVSDRTQTNQSSFRPPPTVFLILAPPWPGAIYLPFGSPNSFSPSPSLLHVNKSRAFSSFRLFDFLESSHVANQLDAHNGSA